MNRMRNGIVRGIVCAVIVLFCTGVLPAVEFAGGTGEPNDPYQIATAEQLIAIGSDASLAVKHFLLAADIDLSGITWPEPVIPFFTGTLDGNGHTIRGLIARGVGPQGLFGQIPNTGRVMNLSLVDFDLTGTNAVGALAAYNSGTVRNCSSTGRIVSVAYIAGGLVGSNSGSIAGSFSIVDVTGNGHVGGLAGHNQGGTLFDCWSTGTVLGGMDVGGLVGSNQGSISSSYSASEVMGDSDLGGLVSSNGGSISACYSAGFVAGGNDAGGLVGYNGGKISSSYASAGVTSHGSYTALFIGGLVGRTSTSTGGTVRDSYFLAPSDGGGPDNKIGTPRTIAQMKQQASFAGWGFWGTDADETDEDWFMPDDAFPVLAWQTEITGLQLVPDIAGLPLDRARAALTTAGFVPGDVSYDFHRAYPADFAIHALPSTIAPVSGIIDLVLSVGTAYDWADNAGDGTEDNPYQIQTAGQLEFLGDHPELWDKHFVLTADLDMVGRTYPTGLIAPDTSRFEDDFQGTAFTGVLDGRAHTIRNLTILADDRGYVGLFGMVGQTGDIRGLNLQGAFVKAPSTSGTGTRRSSTTTFIGVLAGYSEGTFADCSVVDSILIGRNRNDGLVGINHGSIVNCHADITVVNVSSSVR